MVYEWDRRKAEANRQKHGVSFPEAVSVFVDPLAWSFPDPDHSVSEQREITIGRTRRGRVVFVSHCLALPLGGATSTDHSRAFAALNSMKKAPTKKTRDELRPEYDLAALKGGVRGKYFRPAIAGSNVVLIDPDLSAVFPDAASVNRALRALAEAAKGVVKRSSGGSSRRMQPTRGKAARG